MSSYTHQDESSGFSTNAHSVDCCLEYTKNTILDIIADMVLCDSKGGWDLQIAVAPHVRKTLGWNIAGSSGRQTTTTDLQPKETFERGEGRCGVNQVHGLLDLGNRKPVIHSINRHKHIQFFIIQTKVSTAFITISILSSTVKWSFFAEPNKNLRK